ncbi:MAG: ribonuclease HII [Mycoplasmataceae bacterium]|jgi:ribonuclease HII|nr:ribonuclease HII [Mycoplasmataceae bacterium]
MIKNNLYEYENKCIQEGYKLIAGTDEVGRGCLAGPLVTACCILPINYVNDKINDSKKLSSKQREELFDIIIKDAIAYEIFFVDSNEVDKLNPKKASVYGMEQCIKKIKIKPDIILIDAEKINTDIPTISIIKGDAKSITIAAASILAKVARDRYMVDTIDIKYPMYHFKKHKGYGTKLHMNALMKFGPIKNLHRFSYKPVKELVIE